MDTCNRNSDNNRKKRNEKRRGRKKTAAAVTFDGVEYAIFLAVHALVSCAPVVYSLLSKHIRCVFGYAFCFTTFERR